MTQEGFKRKLTAILSADVEGYSRLMGDDEESTIRTLKDYRETMEMLIEQHRGRIVDATGDNLLAEFASVVDAVTCAAAIQQKLAERNAELPETRKMQFRIGVNLGDVVTEGDRIYGDGVNIAARMEGLASGGGICISGNVYDQVKNKLDFGYEYSGEHTVKNIIEPVRVYQVLLKPEAIGKLIGDKKPVLRRWHLAAVVIVLVIGAVGTIWHFYFRPPVEPDSVDKMAFPLPDKPSIAVLPFANLIGDPEQEYFSDGISNDIITDLSKFHELFVIASNTMFTYKGKAVNVKNVGRDLGVRYVLEGSVQKADEKVRVNAQLIETSSGYHLWAERYDRDIKDLFALQDEIVQTVVAKLALKIDTAEQARAMQKDTANLEAYDYLQRGWEYYRRRTRSANLKARHMFKKALELDPNYASAYVGLGWTYFQDVGYGWTEFTEQSLQQAFDLARKALSLDESNASAHALTGSVYNLRGQHDLAINELQRAIEINPNDANSYHQIGWVLLWSGKVDEAIEAYETAIRLDIEKVGTQQNLGMAYYLKRRYDDAKKLLERATVKRPDYAGYYIVLAATYAQLGRTVEAKRSAGKVLELDPFFKLENFGSAFRNQEHRKAVIEGLRMAGLN